MSQKRKPVNLFNNKDSKRTVEGTVIIGFQPENRPKNLPAVPTAANYSAYVSRKDYEQPSHKIGFGLMKTSKLSQHKLEMPADSGTPKFVGSSYHHLVGRMKSDVIPPRNASVPRAYVPPAVSEFRNCNLLANRATSGILFSTYFFLTITLFLV